MIFENENANEGMQAVINELYQYLPRVERKNGVKFSGQGVVGDQLSVERGVNSLMQIANGVTEFEYSPKNSCLLPSLAVNNSSVHCSFLSFNSEITSLKIF